MSGCPGKGLETTQATLSWRANSREINSPPEKPLAYHPSSGARDAMNLLAASLAQKTGSTLSPQRKKVWGTSWPVASHLTMR